MTLVRTVRLLSMALVVVAAIPIADSGELPPPAWAILAAGLAAGWFAGGRPWPRPYVLLLTGLLIACFFSMIVLSVQNGEWLVN
ncbi:MAG: hypothetical protein FJ098_16995, partial [Deltaproteobacteria bacterium]|nr:hypothetical protein [Deltaproteobacteria bacterium]